MAVTLDGLTVDMPKDWAPTLMEKSFESSVVGQLTQAKPIPLDGETIPIYDGGFEVGYVPEGNRKPVSDVEMRFDALVPKKFAGILVVSKELARRNPGAMLEHVEADMINGVARQVDYAVLYARAALTGNPVPETTAVNQTTNRVELTAGGDLVDQLTAGYDLAADGDADPNGWAFDSRFRTRVSRASQVQDGAMPNLAANVASFAGMPAAFGRTVAGRVGRNTDTGVRGFVGDWDKVRWGFSEDIDLTRSNEATIVDGEGNSIHLFQDNMIALRLEFEIGWWVRPGAFAAIESAGGEG